MNSQDQQQPNSFLKTITIIHLALLMGQLIFAVLAFTINGSTAIVIDTNDTYLFVEIIMVIGCFIASTILFKRQLVEAIQQGDVSSKLTRYQTALIIRCALLEGASLFGIVNYMISGNLLYLIISGLIILYFLSFRPTKEKIKEDLQLSYDEVELL